LDVHKPKPVQSLREFAVEVGTIVLGVAIALMGEQAVEWLHWRHVVHEARTAIRDELLLDARAAADQVLYLPCQAQRLDALVARLEQPGSHWRGENTWGHGGLPRPFEAPMRPWIAAAWESAIADGAASHMDRGEMSLYAALYTLMPDFRRMMASQQQSVSDLAFLARDQELTAAARDRAVTAAEHARTDSYWSALGARQYLAGLAELGLRLTPKDRAAEIGFLHRRVGDCVNAAKLD
jgi:hypothetical protein